MKVGITALSPCRLVLPRSDCGFPVGFLKQKVVFCYSKKVVLLLQKTKLGTVGAAGQWISLSHWLAGAIFSQLETSFFWFFDQKKPPRFPWFFALVFLLAKNWFPYEKTKPC